LAFRFATATGAFAPPRRNNGFQLRAREETNSPLPDERRIFAVGLEGWPLARLLPCFETHRCAMLLYDEVERKDPWQARVNTLE